VHTARIWQESEKPGCTHIAAFLFTAEANIKVKSQFSCTHCLVHGYCLHFKKFHMAKYLKLTLSHPSENENYLWIYHHHLGRIVRKAYQTEKYIMFPNQLRMI